VWQAGDAWRIQFADGKPVCSIIVVSANASGYQQGTSCTDDQTEVVATSLASYSADWLGEMTLDLGVRTGDRVTAFYDWPLSDGKTWATSIDGADAQVTANYSMVQGPHGDEPGYKLEMAVGGKTLIAYDYVPSIQWWSQIDFPQASYTAKIVEHTTGWAGPVVVGHADTRYANGGSPVNLFLPQGNQFNMKDTDTKVTIAILRPGIEGGHLSLKDPKGTEVLKHVGTTNSGQTLGFRYDGFWIQFFDSVPGTWTLEEENVGLGSVFLQIKAVQLETVTL
jgi:hypothetical protein